MKDLAEAEHRTRELAATIARSSANNSIAPTTIRREAVVDVKPDGVMRSVSGTLKRGVKVFAGMLGVMGVVLAANALTLGVVNRIFGLVPRSIFGLPGIFLHPLLHANLQHFAMNALGLVTVGGAVFLRSERDFWRVTLFATLFGGALTWLVGPSAIHVGASGIVFGYLGYLLTTGWFDRKASAIVLSLGAAALWVAH